MCIQDLLLSYLFVLLPNVNIGIRPVYFAMMPPVNDDKALTAADGILTNPTIHSPKLQLTKDCVYKRWLIHY